MTALSRLEPLTPAQADRIVQLSKVIAFVLSVAYLASLLMPGYQLETNVLVGFVCWYGAGVVEKVRSR